MSTKKQPLGEIILPLQDICIAQLNNKNHKPHGIHMNCTFLFLVFFCYLTAPNLSASQVNTKTLNLYQELRKVIPQNSLISIDFESVYCALETVLLLQQPKAFEREGLAPLFSSVFKIPIPKSASGKKMYLCRHPGFPKLFYLLHDYAHIHFTPVDYQAAMLQASYTALNITNNFEILAKLLAFQQQPLIFCCQCTTNEMVYEDTGQKINFRASIQRFEKIVALLLTQKVNINQQNISGLSCLTRLSFLNEYTVAFMLNANANPDLASKKGQTFYTRMAKKDTERKEMFPEHEIVPLAEHPRVKEALAAYYQRLEAYKKIWVAEMGESFGDTYIPIDLIKIMLDYSHDVWNMPTIIPPIDAIEDIQYDNKTITSH